MEPHDGPDRGMNEVNGTVSSWVSVFCGLGQDQRADVHVSQFCDKFGNYPWQRQALGAERRDTFMVRWRLAT